jgi:hypothetical protein
MRHRLLSALLILFTLLACASLALEVIGLLREDKLTTQVAGRGLMIGNMPHHIWILSYSLEATANSRVVEHAGAIPARAVYLEPRVGRVSARSRGTTVNMDVLNIPHWLTFLLTAPWPAWWFVRHRKLRSRRRAGLCMHCGYDLRASTDRCPECGEVHRDTGVSPVRAVS